MNIFEKIKFLLRKPKIVVLTDNNKELIKRMVAKIIDSSIMVEREILFVNKIEKIDFSSKEYLIFNFDKEDIRPIKEGLPVKTLTFGFQEGADFQVTDIKINDGTNFKVNYEGKVVPFWLDKILTDEEINSVLTAIAIGTTFDLNLVEISQSLKNFNIGNKV